MVSGKKGQSFKLQYLEASVSIVGVTPPICHLLKGCFVIGHVCLGRHFMKILAHAVKIPCLPIS